MVDLNDIIKVLNKELKDDKHIKNLGLAENFLNFDSFVPFGMSTGLPQLDLMLTRLGYPAGRIIEVYGFERSGKTAMAMMAAAECQRQGGNVLWIETEQTFDNERARRSGIDLTKLLLIEVESVEAIFRTAETVMKNIGEISKSSPFLIIVDSVTAATTEHELDQDQMKAEDRTGHEAKTIRRGVKRLNPLLSRSGATALFINHAIASIGGFGNTKQAAGGHALKFFASLRINLQHTKQLKTTDKTGNDGQEIGFTIEKYKGAAERQTKMTETLKDGVFNRFDSLRLAMLETNILKKVGYSNELNWDNEILKFSPEDFSDIVEKCGGFTLLYDNVKQIWQEKGLVVPWGVK